MGIRVMSVLQCVPCTLLIQIFDFWLEYCQKLVNEDLKPCAFLFSTNSNYVLSIHASICQWSYLNIVYIAYSEKGEIVVTFCCCIDKIKVVFLCELTRFVYLVKIFKIFAFSFYIVSVLYPFLWLFFLFFFSGSLD